VLVGKLHHHPFALGSGAIRTGEIIRRVFTSLIYSAARDAILSTATHDKLFCWVLLRITPKFELMVRGLLLIQREEPLSLGRLSQVNGCHSEAGHEKLELLLVTL
jgi:hypothetical protein